MRGGQGKSKRDRRKRERYVREVRKVRDEMNAKIDVINQGSTRRWARTSVRSTASRFLVSFCFDIFGSLLQSDRIASIL
jgi:hypothetical protein